MVGEISRTVFRRWRAALAAGGLLALVAVGCNAAAPLSTQLPASTRPPAPTVSPTPLQPLLQPLEATTDIPTAQSAATAAPEFPFIIPAQGYLGLKRGDSYGTGRGLHTGIDIWASPSNGRLWTDKENERGQPVYAVYRGELGLAGSGVQICHPVLDSDVWRYLPAYKVCSYYAHLKDIPQPFWQAYCPGQTVPVQQGELLGYMNYDPDGDSVHLHFSVVLQDKDGCGMDERELGYTVTPFPYFALNARQYGWLDEFP